MRLTVVLLHLTVVVTVGGKPPKHCDDSVPVNNCNCHCNLHPDSRLRDAVSVLERKVDYLIALTLNVSVPNPIAQVPTFLHARNNTKKTILQRAASII